MQWLIPSEIPVLLASPGVVPHGRVVLKSNTDDRPLSCEQILSVDTKSFTLCIGWLQMAVCPPDSTGDVNHTVLLAESDSLQGLRKHLGQVHCP